MTERQAGIRRFLAETPLLQGLASEDLGVLSRTCSVRRVPAGGTLALRQSPVTGVTGVQVGFLKAFVSSPRGERFLGDVVGPGEWLGIGPFMRGRPRVFDLQAEGETTVVTIDGPAFRAISDRDPRLARNAALVIAERYDRALEQLRARSFLDVEARLALRLTRLLEAHGVVDPRGDRALPFRVSQEELGQLIGATRETVGRSLRVWGKRGWVDLGYARLVVRSPEELTRLFEAPAAQRDPRGNSRTSRRHPGARA